MVGISNICGTKDLWFLIRCSTKKSLRSSGEVNPAAPEWEIYSLLYIGDASNAKNGIAANGMPASMVSNNGQYYWYVCGIHHLANAAGMGWFYLVHFKSSIQDTSNFLSSWDTKNVSDESNMCYWQWVSRFLLDAPPVYKISVSNLRLSGTWPSGSPAVPEPSISGFERKLLHSSYPYHHQQRHIKPGLFGRVTKFTEGVNSRLLSNFERFDTLITSGLPEKSLTSIT